MTSVLMLICVGCTVASPVKFYGTLTTDGQPAGWYVRHCLAAVLLAGLAVFAGYLLTISAHLDGT